MAIVGKKSHLFLWSDTELVTVMHIHAPVQSPRACFKCGLEAAADWYRLLSFMFP